MRPLTQYCALLWTRSPDALMSNRTLGERAMAKISVLLSAAEDARFAAYCAERGHKKSTLIARLIREHLDHEGFALQGTLFGRAPPPAESSKPRPGRKRP